MIDLIYEPSPYLREELGGNRYISSARRHSRSGFDSVFVAMRLDFELCFERFGDALFTEPDPALPAWVSAWYVSCWIEKEERVPESETYGDVVRAMGGCRDEWSAEFKRCLMETKLNGDDEDWTQTVARLTGITCSAPSKPNGSASAASTNASASSRPTASPAPSTTAPSAPVRGAGQGIVFYPP